MNAKQTSEGYIFHCEGAGEASLVRSLIGGDKSNPLAQALLGRLDTGNGAFCVFYPEASEFNALLSAVESNRSLGIGPLEEIVQRMLAVMMGVGEQTQM